MLVNCVAYQDGQKLADVATHDIHRYLARPGSFVWVALRDPEPRALEVMQAEFGLHRLAVEDAQHGHQLPKIEEYGDSLFAVLHIIELEKGELRSGEVNVFVGPNYVLSVRRGAQKGFADVRKRCEQEPQLLRAGSVYVLYALMDAVVDRYFPVLQSIESELEHIEERIFSESVPRRNIEDLYALKQKLTVLRHAVRPLLESVGSLAGAHVPTVCSGMQEYFRDIADHLQRLNQTIESIRDTLTTAISVNLSMITLQDSETMKQLAAYAALLAVPTLIVGIYGMNFEHMPELHWRYGYALALLVMAALDGYLFYRFRKTKWL